MKTSVFALLTFVAAPAAAQIQDDPDAPCYEWTVRLRHFDTTNTDKDIRVADYQTLTQDDEGLYKALAYAFDNSAATFEDWSVVAADSKPTSECDNVTNPDDVPAPDPARFGDEMCVRMIYDIIDARDPLKYFTVSRNLLDNSYGGVQIDIEDLEDDERYRGVEMRYKGIFELYEFECWWDDAAKPNPARQDLE